MAQFVIKAMDRNMEAFRQAKKVFLSR